MENTKNKQKLKKNNVLERQGSTKNIFLILVLAFFIGFSLIGMGSAFYENVTNQTTGIIYDTPHFNTHTMGNKVTIGAIDLTLLSITKNGGDASTMGYLLNSTYSKIANATFSGDTATFSEAPIMMAGKSYFIVGDSLGASRSIIYKGGTNFPIINSHLTWVAGLDDVAENSNAYNIDYITVGYNFVPTSAVTLVSPVNDTNTTLTHQIFNATYYLGANDTFVNASVYLWDFSGTLLESSITTANTSLIRTLNLPLMTNMLWNYRVYFSNSSGIFYITAPSNRTINRYLIVENSQTYNPTTIEGASETFGLNMSFNNTFYYGTNAILVYENSNYTGIPSVTGNNVNFIATVSIPNVPALQNNSFYWVIEVTNTTGVFYFNSTSHIQAVQNINFDNCSVYSNVIYNLTLYDETSRTYLNPSVIDTTIEATLTLSTIGTQNNLLNLSHIWTNQNPAQFCSDINLTGVSYRSDMLVSYNAEGYVQEFHYITNGILNNNTSPNIPLYDLLASDSTSFLMTYQDENYLYVQDAIIDLWRQYVGTGEFISVEQAKTDAGGQTRLHLVTEDVVYKFLVWKDGELLYTSPELIALCQASPCQINLRKPFGEVTSLSIFDNIIYSLTFDKANRKVDFTFSTKDGTTQTMRLLVLKADAYENTTVCDNTLTTNGGILTCTVPQAFDNTTYIAQVYRINSPQKLFGYFTFSLSPDAFENFGNTGIILSVFSFLALAFMGISSGVATIVLGILGLVLVSLMMLFNGGSVFGIGSAIIWLIVAGIIIIVKINNRRIS